jgi:hypothetical protein
MPNHIHALLAFRNTQGQSINTIIGNGKRFIAYELIAKLMELGTTVTRLHTQLCTILYIGQPGYIRGF